MRRKPRLFLKQLTLISCVAALTPELTLCAKEEPNEESETKSAFPTLDILPEGSILQSVRLPRYDKDFNPSSLLTAEKLTVIDGDRIDGVNVNIQLYGKDGKVQAQTQMRHAIYNQKKSILHANEAITLRGEKFKASGKGLIFHWVSKRGFLIGPATTEFVTSTLDTSSAMLLRPNKPSITLAGTILTLTTCLIAEPPAQLTPAQLAKLDQLSRPSTAKLQQSQQTTALNLAEEDALNAKANTTMTPFLQTIGQGALLVQTNSKPTPPPITPVKNTAPPKIPKTPEGANQPEPAQLLQIECDGGIYFDNDAGILAYLKNIRLTEPRFKLTCSKELKVFLNQKPTDPAKATKKTAKGSVKEQPTNTNTKQSTHTPNARTGKNPAETVKKTDKKKEGSLTASFGDLKRIVASGNVKLIRKDEKGSTYIASGETASYDAQTGTMILRGGFPRIQAAANQYLQAQEEGLYITVLKNGSWTTATGKWKMLTPTDLKKKTP